MQRSSVVCPVQVGRDAEARAIRAAIEAVRGSGNGRLVLLGGEAGVGKTRITSETASWTADTGMGVLEGHCTIDSGTPYAAFVTALRRRTRTMDDSALATLFAGAAAPAAALLPELPWSQDVPAASPDALFAGVWHVLRRLAGPSGALLVLEDVHWADPDSLRLLEYLARETADLPVCVLANYRTDELHRRHPLQLALSELGRERRYVDVRLEPLDLELVRAMLSAIFDGATVGDEFARAVLDRTDGNPFFVEELMKVLVERGDVYLSDGEWERRDLAEIELPISVRESLLARAHTMPDGDLEVLQVAALAGVDFEPSVLAGACGRDLDAIDDVIQRALQLQFLAERRDSGVTSYAFRHALSREAFGDELVGPQRRHAHRRLADAIREVHAAELEHVAPALADHLEAAGELRAAEPFALMAARTAAAAFARDEGDRRYDQALRAHPEPDAGRLALLLEAARTSTPGEVTALEAAFAREALDLAGRLGDVESQVQALLVLDRERWLAGEGAEAVRLMEQARLLVRGRDPHTEATVLNRLTRLLALADRAAEADPMLPEAIELARTSGNLSALAGLHSTRMMYSRYEDGFWPNFEPALAAAKEAGDSAAEGNLCTNGGFISLWNCDFRTSERMLRRAMDIYRSRLPHERYPHAGLAWLLALSGRYDEATELARPLLSGYPKPTVVVALTALAEVATTRQDADAERYAPELVELASGMGEKQRSVPALTVECRRRLAAGDVSGALETAELLMAQLEGANAGSHWNFSPELCEGLAAEHRRTELEHWLERLRRKTELDANAGNRTALAACEGHAARVRGDLGAAASHFSAALAGYEQMPAPSRVIAMRLALAEAALAADPELAAEHASAALAQAGPLGLEALAGRAQALLERTRSRAVLATVLFTDIVGSTEQAVNLGDLAWRDLIERHHAIVRSELARGGGREIDTAGDGFLAAFPTPATAIRTATSIRDSLARNGITIRAGVHTGECEESDGKLTGLTVHIAARVSQAAGGGEVLVSQTVRDLVAGSQLAFDDRGTHALKGIPGDWRLFAVLPS